MMKLWIGLLLPYCLLFGEDPWGKDADMAFVSTVSPSCYSFCKTPLIGAAAERVIRFHQEVISPADGPRSHFIPCSSQYMLDAIRKYGFICGFPMGCDRLMRENNDPWIYRKTRDARGCAIKYDPIR